MTAAMVDMLREGVRLFEQGRDVSSSNVRFWLERANKLVAPLSSQGEITTDELLTAIAKAHPQLREHEFEIDAIDDDDASLVVGHVSGGSGGCWVAGWLWLPSESLPAGMVTDSVARGAYRFIEFLEHVPGDRVLQAVRALSHQTVWCFDRQLVLSHDNSLCLSLWTIMCLLLEANGMPIHWQELLDQAATPDDLAESDLTVANWPAAAQWAQRQADVPGSQSPSVKVMQALLETDPVGMVAFLQARQPCPAVVGDSAYITVVSSEFNAAEEFNAADGRCMVSAMGLINGLLTFYGLPTLVQKWQTSPRMFLGFGSGARGQDACE